MAVYCPICEVRVSSRAALPGHYRRAHRDRELPRALNISRQEARQRLSGSAPASCRELILSVSAVQREPALARSAIVSAVRRRERVHFRPVVGKAEKQMIEECARQPLEALTGDQIRYYLNQVRASGVLATRAAENRPAVRPASQRKNGDWVYPVVLGLLDLFGVKLRKAAICKQAESQDEQGERNAKPRRVLDESKFRSGYWPGAE
jgi:hypothetical protein